MKGTSTPVWTIVGIIAVRYVFLPIIGVVVVQGAIKFGLVQPDPLYQFVLLLQYALPPAMNIGNIFTNSTNLNCFQIVIFILPSGTCRNYGPVVWIWW